MNNLATLIIERLDKKEKIEINEVCNVIHIKGRGVDERYKILGKKKDLNYEWLRETIKSFYATHKKNVPKTINITYFKEE